MLFGSPAMLIIVLCSTNEEREEIVSPSFSSFPTANWWDPALGTPRVDKYYNQYRPQCEVCPRDHCKVEESLQGVVIPLTGKNIQQYHVHLSLERLYHLAVVSGAHFTLGTILIVILVPSGSAKSRVPPVHRGWLSR